MFRNYLLVGIRSIWRHKFYAFINVLGLMLGITVSFYISLYVLDELSYDRFNKNIDRMYRLGLHGKIGDQEVFTTNTAPVIASALTREIPEIRQSTRIERWDNIVVSYQDKAFTDDNIYLVDSNFFNFFTYHLIKGDPNTVLSQPNSMVMTQKIAGKFFGDEDPIGKLVKVGSDDKTFKITGVVENPPANSHMNFNYLLSISSYKWMADDDDWLDNHLYTYFTVYPGADMKNIQTKLNDMVVNHVGPRLSQVMGISLQQFLSQKGVYGYLITPVKDIHLYSHLEDELEPSGNIAYVYIFSAIGLFIILIASINFINLSTARSAGRSREVGLRKTFGSLRKQLVGQFMMEAIIYSVIAMLLAFLVASLFLPQFNEIAGKSIRISGLFAPKMVAVIAIITIIVGFLSGLYPAFFLTRFNVAEVMKGQVTKGVKGKGLRGMLVILQFSLSIILIICTLIVFKQLEYLENKNLGFDKKNVLVLLNMNLLGQQKDVFKDKLMQESSIVAASYCSHVIPGANQTGVFKKPGSDQNYIVSRYWADYEQADALGLKIIEGRNFSRDFPSDSTATLVNQEVVKEFGWDDPIGREIISYGDNDEPVRLRVIGVIKDFNFESLRQAIRPLMINLTKEGGAMVVRYRGNNPDQAVHLVEKIWKELLPNKPFNYSFLDQNFDHMYKAEQHLSKLFTIFTFFAIFIACMGLLGLSAFTAEQRTKEIGIRKALGASGASVVGLLSKEFTRFVIISFLIAILPSWYVMNQWLQGFAFRIPISYGVFIVSGLLALIIAILTISYQSLKAARTNPAESLRYE